MNSLPANSATTTSATSRKRPARRVLAVLAVSVVGLAACSSDPGPKRVAEDIIETAIEQGDLTDEQGQCMFDKVETYSDKQLEEITDSVDDAGPGTAIELFEADLASCK